MWVDCRRSIAECAWRQQNCKYFVIPSRQKIMSGGTATFGDYYSTIVGEVGIAANRANSASKAQSDIIKQLNNIREQISGVSLDEETTKMIEYQKSFDASARLIRTADEMLIRF